MVVGKVIEKRAEMHAFYVVDFLILMWYTDFDRDEIDKMISCRILDISSKLWSVYRQNGRGNLRMSLQIFLY